MNIALFGTSADPPTLGHQAILEWLATRFDQVAVWASDNPFKPKQTPLHHRQAMLALMIETLAVVHDNVALLPQLAYSRSLYSVQQAQTDFPDSELTLVVGSDLVDTIPTWYGAHELLRLVKLLIVPRPGTPIQSTNLQALETMGGRLAIADFEGPRVSSTDYRQQGHYSMIPAIADYIKHHSLYSQPDQE